jgi:hypothetical protein
MAVAAQAQCTFTPTITPDPVMLCPGGSLSLETRTYDSCLLFESAQPENGQTSQLHQFGDASVGNSFTLQQPLGADRCGALTTAPLTVGAIG